MHSKVVFLAMDLVYSGLPTGLFTIAQCPAGMSLGSQHLINFEPVLKLTFVRY